MSSSLRVGVIVTALGLSLGVGLCGVSLAGVSDSEARRDAPTGFYQAGGPMGVFDAELWRPAELSMYHSLPSQGEIAFGLWADGTLCFSEDKRVGGAPYLRTTIDPHRAVKIIESAATALESLESLPLDFLVHDSAWSVLSLHSRSGRSRLMSTYVIAETRGQPIGWNPTGSASYGEVRRAWATIEGEVWSSLEDSLGGGVEAVVMPAGALVVKRYPPRTGTERVYYPNGQLRFECVWLDDQRNGPMRKYYEDGALWRRGFYFSGRKVGLWEEFSRKGDLMFSKKYGLPKGLSH